ncbi:hypothetical protein PF002_g15034 [Phytophthora fragariae]|uniref:Uncharacterized protein n=1 Tax=Phytophthora fragariae TaxID=53985 RepID=A0A6A3EV13_9STRA|nr:hypothetical protein PF003_g40192 [Phytophthora fragariae]KAE8936217.1 hypothetical protein PF009_g13850 [Phytophthora fragariae]KAE8998648.1 hypothetical protein PF011_g14966 [Phytophthora fragariae]KAE9105425.1 hypothetical protein PF007_g13713 [Phytophthora fragariae]KAE9133913.1 hypothetical protein PF006_g14931 [Phytophthora fragariae]
MGYLIQGMLGISVIHLLSFVLDQSWHMQGSIVDYRDITGISDNITDTDTDIDISPTMSQYQ